MLLAYAKAEPTKDTVALYVGNTLLANSNLDDAVAVYRGAAKAMPENRLIEVQLASALLRAGKADEAIATARAALAGSTDPDVLNDGAYVLVSHDAELHVAESSARKAVDLLEAESAATSIESVNTRSFRRMTLLLASWDTLGWIYFAERKADIGEQYVRAAWNSGVHREVELHLGEIGEILEKRGDRVKAMELYEIVLATLEGDANAPIIAELCQKVAALAKQGVAQHNPHTQAVSQAQRTFHMPPPSALKGSAIFYLQVSATKTKMVVFVGGDEPLRSQEQELAHLNLGLAVLRDSHALLLRSGVLFAGPSRRASLYLHP